MTTHFSHPTQEGKKKDRFRKQRLRNSFSHSSLVLLWSLEEVGMELEDDLFFADLNRQISLLIMDDDEDPNALCPSASLQAFSRAVQYPPAQAPFSQNIQQNNCRRDQSKGTGVFIPQQSHPRRKNSRQGRFNTSKLQYRHSAENSIPRAERLPTPASSNPKKC